MRHTPSPDIPQRGNTAVSPRARKFSFRSVFLFIYFFPINRRCRSQNLDRSFSTFSLLLLPIWPTGDLSEFHSQRVPHYNSRFPWRRWTMGGAKRGDEGRAGVRMQCPTMNSYITARFSRYAIIAAAVLAELPRTPDCIVSRGAACQNPHFPRAQINPVPHSRRLPSCLRQVPASPPMAA